MAGLLTKAPVAERARANKNGLTGFLITSILHLNASWSSILSHEADIGFRDLGHRADTEDN